MAGKNWQAGGKDVIPSRAVVCLLATAMPCSAAWAVSNNFAPTSYIGSADPNMIWEMLIGGIVVASFLVAIGLWILSAVRKVRRSQLRRNAFVSSALNNLSQGVVMTDAKKRIVFCNDRYLEIYGLVRSDVPRNMTGPELLKLRRKRRARRQRRGFLSKCRQAGRTYYRVAKRAIDSGQVFPAAERRVRGDP